VSAFSTVFNGAVYSVQVRGAGGTVTSNNVTLTVNGSPIGPKFGSVVNLTSLASVDGSRILGKRQSEEAYHVFGGCDVNGDKFSDVIVGAPSHELVPGRGDLLARGAAYVVFGKPGGIGQNFRVADLNGNNGFMIRGADTHTKAGKSVSCAGDVNGDGLGDLLIGATSGYDSGAAYVVFGKIGGFPPIVELASLNGTDGFKIQGGNLDRAGLSVAAGDVNKDGFSDVIVGAFPNSGPGAAFVVFGKAGGFAPTLNVSGLNGANGFKISGEANVDSTGANARLAAADVSGDGFADIILGSDKGAYVVYGKSGGFAPNLSLSGLNGANGSKFVDGGLRIQSVAAVGDINGDKIADFTVGVRNGGRHVVFGKPGGFGATVNLQALGNTAGFKIAGLLDYSTAAGVDLNGDGFSDVAVSHKGHQNKGTVYVIYGKAGGFTNINVSSLNGTNGFRIEGEAAGGGLGVGQGAGDYNGDGIHDLLLASSANFSFWMAGTSYVIYGKR
ncbi:MAG: integrin alpha, partial [Pseudomonadota bacterium]